MRLEIYRDNKLIDSKESGDFEIDLRYLPVIKTEKVRNILKVWIK